MQIHILGSNAATPMFNRHPSAQIVQIREQFFLVDCGEAAQMRMQLFGIKSSRIQHIFISHLHGDHYFGLIALLNSMALMGRTIPLYIYCYPKLKEIIDIQMDFSFPYPLHYHFLKEEQEEILLENETVLVRAFPVYHSVPTHGFLFIQKEKKRRLDLEALRAFEIPKYFYNKIQDGYDYETKTGELIKNEDLSFAGKEEKTYAYCADTAPHEKYLSFIEKVQLLYHEATYTEKFLDKAQERKHSTALQAAQIAIDAKVEKLLIGHFSSRYKNPEELLLEAKSIFENTYLAVEGKVFEV